MWMKAVYLIFPKNGSKTEKFNLNACALFNGISGIGFRSSRLNHSCSPNVQDWQVEGTSIKVFYSANLIRTGDEICMSYRSIWSFLSEEKESLQRSFYETSCTFEMKWGIVCPSDCICKDLAILPVIAEFSRWSKIAVKSG
jgi:hypothetical protein